MTAIIKRSRLLRLFFSFRDNLTSLSINGFPASNLANFGFAPQNQILIFIYNFNSDLILINLHSLFHCCKNMKKMRNIRIVDFDRTLMISNKFYEIAEIMSFSIFLKNNRFRRFHQLLKST